MTSEQAEKLRGLILLAFEGLATKEQIAELQNYLAEDPEAIDYYLSYADILTCLKFHSSLTLREVHPDEPDVLAMDDSRIFREILEQDMQDSAIRKIISRISKSESLPKVSGVSHVARKRYPVNRREFYTAIFKIAAVIMLAAGLVWLDRQLWRQFGQPPVTVTAPVAPVAKVTDLMGGLSESGMETACQIGGELYPSTFVLGPSGLAELTFVNETKVILEGPARFELIDPKTMFLQEGKLYARVSKEATGFTILGESARVIDLGTVFGMQVEKGGISRVYTYEGKVSFASRDGDEIREKMIVSAGQACQIRGTDGVIGEIPFQKNYFVQQMDSRRRFVWRGQPLNLADIVGGGDGFGDGHSVAGVDPQTGNLLTGKYQLHFRDRMTGPNYTSVPQNPFIDGVFVPDGGERQVVVSSTGLVFAECPDTNGDFYADVSNFPMLSPAGYSSLLSEFNFSQQDNTVISLHANLGVTFDLDAVRKSLGATQINRFRSRCGLVAPGDEVIDMRVLVDGVVRYEAIDISFRHGLQSVDIPLNRTDRFLTLVTTCGSSKNIHCDWGAFVDPCLDLE